MRENYSGKIIAKNTIYNLLGYGIPLLLAVIIFPLLIKGLGEEKFGILSLIWIIVGYFSFFDLGIGRALTKIVSEKIGMKQINDIPAIFWTSFYLMLFISSFFGVVLFFSSPLIILKLLNISPKLQSETLNSFYILSFLLPVVTTTAGLRGFLEAYQEFGIVNFIRVLLGIFSFLGPLICLIFTTNLLWITLFFVVLRLAIWSLFMKHCIKLNIGVNYKFNFNFQLVKSIFKLSGWMTISNIVVPVFVYLDRFLIGALISVSAITYYSSPYEVISKLLIIPGALTAVLFPAFSANYMKDKEFTQKLTLKAVKYIFILLYPICLLIITFSNEALSIWLGENFAKNSTLVLQLLALGVLFVSIAYIPYTFIEGIGRPDITAKIQLLEMPFYVGLMWILVKQEGIIGAAIGWAVRTFVDSAILFLFAKKFSVNLDFSLSLKHLVVTVIFLSTFFIFLINNLYVKMIIFCIIMSIFIYLNVRYFIGNDEKKVLYSLIEHKN